MEKEIVKSKSTTPIIISHPPKLDHDMASAPPCPARPSFILSQRLWELLFSSYAISVPLHLLKQAIWGNIWKLTVEKSQTSATSVTASSRADVLRRHLKTHSGEKPNKCNQCNYASSEASQLRRHLITYTGETKRIASSVFRIHLRTVIHKSATLGKSHTNAFLGMIFPTISPHTRSSTVVINILNVVSVTLCHLSQVISRSTCLFTQERNLWSV